MLLIGKVSAPLAVLTLSLCDIYKLYYALCVKNNKCLIMSSEQDETGRSENLVFLFNQIDPGKRVLARKIENLNEKIVN